MLASVALACSETKSLHIVLFVLVALLMAFLARQKRKAISVPQSSRGKGEAEADKVTSYCLVDKFRM